MFLENKINKGFAVYKLFNYHYIISKFIYWIETIRILVLGVKSQINQIYTLRHLLSFFRSTSLSWLSKQPRDGWLDLILNNKLYTTLNYNWTNKSNDIIIQSSSMKEKLPLEEAEEGENGRGPASHRSRDQLEHVDDA